MYRQSLSHRKNTLLPNHVSNASSIHFKEEQERRSLHMPVEG